jgi:hypothetical protein
MHYPQALEAAMGIRRRCGGPAVGVGGAGAGSVAAGGGVGGAGAGSVAGGGGASGGPAVTPSASRRTAAGSYTHSYISEPLKVSLESA